MSRWIATVFGVGYLRPAPGTWGSIAALPLAWAVLIAGGAWLLVALTIAVTLLGYWATVKETQGQDNHDPSEIVVDEVAGQWIALLPVAYGAELMQTSYLALWPGWLAALLFFRFFDIQKPWLVGWADKRNDAVGVMLDDLIAGAFAAAVVVLLAALAHGALA